MFLFYNLDLYFIEKFPKSTFDYFELFVARVKGVFTNELNKVRGEKRNF